ncbi:MAG: FAD-dependent oxidoreductase [Liquorilactobacillus nagelii]|uniref:FAD-dependent oxidoreductase n=1 Tax=Liquorilactobacillus nagelii TaxID=82688 RepID=UPI0039ED5216
MKKLTDGRYVGTGQGMHGVYRVAVEIVRGKIVKVEVLDQHGTEQFPDLAVKEIPTKILASQSTKVDVVSGATVSSQAIMEAVNNALYQDGGQPEFISQEPLEFSTDVIVVAAGPAGLAAAITAAEKGLRVAVFEKEAITGGTANMGMGPLGIDTKIQRRVFNEITVAEALKNQMEYTHYQVDEALVQRYFSLSSQTIDWLEEMGVKFAGAFRYFKESAATWHIVQPEHGKIGPSAAATMMKKMTQRAKKLGVEFYLQTAVDNLVVEQGRVVGIQATTKQRQKITARSSAVVVCTGGFGSNPQMLQAELNLKLNQNFFTFNVPGIEGDGLKMMWKAGAQKFGISIEAIYVLPHNFNYMIADGVLRQPNLLLNQNGDRFMNEGMMGNTTFTGNAIALQPGKYAYCIMDREILQQYQQQGPDIVDIVHPADGFQVLEKEITKAAENHYDAIITADSVPELADKLKIPVEKLQQTLTEYNQMCAHGKDTLFYKSAKFLHPLTGKGGFLVGKYYQGAYGTVGGVRINSNCEVLNDQQQPIVGLYSAGTDANTIYADSYNFTLPGNSMGFAINSGRIAGSEIARKLKN